jgi:DNA-binding transcriptional LysR family regulator
VIQQCYPRVVIEPDVDMSTSLRDKLLADEVELIVVPDAFDDSRFTSKRVGTAENAWMCKPGMVRTKRPLRIHELAAHRLLTQGHKSGTGLLYERWFKSIGVRAADTTTSNSLVALLGLAVSGLGIGYMPRKCLSPMVEAGLLEVVEVTPELPEAPYAALYKSDRRSTLLASLVMLAQDSCDFGSTFQTDAVA